MLRDSTYIMRISNHLELFVSSGNDRYSFRCPYCGDSKKDPTKTRGCFKRAPWDSYRLIFKCFNCGISRSFRSFLRDLDDSIYRDYLVETVKERHTFESGGEHDAGFWSMPQKTGSEDPLRKNPLPEDFFVPLGSLAKSHPATQYVASRKIPEDLWSRIWFTDDFRGVAHNVDKEKFDKPGQIWPESRIVFPCMTRDSSRMIAFQGRSLDPDAKVRYIMIYADRSGSRLYGLDFVTESKPVIVLEGPIDSFFVENSVALCGATASVDIPFKDRTFFLDQEPRNWNIVERMHKLVDSGESVCILPDEFIEQDANDIYIKHGISREELGRLVIENSYRGQRAKLRLSQWQIAERPTPRKVRQHDSERISN